MSTATEPSFGRPLQLQSQRSSSQPKHSNQPSEDHGDDEHGNGSDRRVRQLERNMAFMRHEHSEMLGALHREIEELKRKNQELHFQLVMHGLSYASLLDSSSVRLDLSGLEVNVKGLQAELHEAKSRNIYLTGLLEEQKKKLTELERQSGASTVILEPLERSKQETDDEDHKYAPTTATTTLPSSSSSKRNASTATSLSTFLDENSSLLRSADHQQQQQHLAKLSEAEDTIQKLKNVNAQQQRELREIKALLDRNAKLKFRGCNHPGSSRPKPTRRPPTNELRQRRMLILSDRSGNNRRAESLDRFPPLGAGTIVPVRRRSKSPGMRGELPPVPGSSGSDSSEVTKRSHVSVITRLNRKPQSSGLESHNAPPSPANNQLPSLGRDQR